MTKHILIRKNHKIIHALWQDNRVMELQVTDTDALSLVGTICIAKVTKVVSNLNAAFVRMGEKEMAFLSLEDVSHGVVYTSARATGKRLVAGDEILVQVTKDPTKTKDATVSTELSLSGRYVVVLSGEKGIHISGKIKQTRQGQNLKTAIVQYMTAHHPEFAGGLIIRTGAVQLAEEDRGVLYTELEQLLERLTHLIQTASYRSCYSVLYRPFPAYLTRLQSAGVVPEQVVTDDAELFAELQTYCSQAYPELVERVTFYEDRQVPFSALYSLGKWMGEALSERVWLPSGGYLVIQPTEALTVIDVNSGKFAGHTSAEETHRRTNAEAAKEIALQMRLRNLSGIVIIDFVDMKQPEYREQLMQQLRQYCKADPVKTTVVDMTKLNLVEVTRQRTTKPIYELLHPADLEKE